MAWRRLAEAERYSMRVDALYFVGAGEMKEVMLSIFLGFLGDSMFSMVKFYILLYLFFNLRIRLSFKAKLDTFWERD